MKRFLGLVAAFLLGIGMIASIAAQDATPTGSAGAYDVNAGAALLLLLGLRLGAGLAPAW